MYHHYLSYGTLFQSSGCNKQLESFRNTNGWIFFMDIFNPSLQEVKRGRSRLEHAVNFYDSVVHSWLKTLGLQTFVCGFHKIFLKYRLCCLWGRTGVGWIWTGPCMPIKPQGTTKTGILPVAHSAMPKGHYQSPFRKVYSQHEHQEAWPGFTSRIRNP